ncbi:MAG: hypothetical protein J6A33_05630 [Alphaproteobacteria bacterium]|nr:hypothetical protein [Alphaproteobacteria bacterium]
MGVSVSAVKNLMVTLGVKADELFSAEEFKTFLTETVAKQGLVISDVFDEKAQKLFIEEWFKSNPAALEKLFSAQSQETFVFNWVKTHPDCFGKLFPTEAERLKKTEEFVADMAKSMASSEQKITAEKQPDAEKTVAAPPVQTVSADEGQEALRDVASAASSQETSVEEKQETPVEEKLEFVRDGNYQFVRQNGLVIGVVIDAGTRKFIVMHDYDQDNLSKEEARKRAERRPTVKGKHWRLLTDDDCRAMCSSLRSGGGKGQNALASLMKKLGGNFCHQEHLTSDYHGPQRYKVKYAVDLD